MRKQLTISEVSKLLELSVHTLRYYEKEGLLKSVSRSGGGYRLYDMEAIDRLETVILLRECGISLKDIKDLLDHFSEEKYTQILDESYDMVTNEIEKLSGIKKKLALVRTVRREYVDGEFKIVPMSRVVINQIERIDDSIYNSPMELYNFYMKYGEEFYEGQKDVFYFVAVKDYLILGKRVSEVEEESLVYESGQYLSYIFSGDLSTHDMGKASKIIKTYIDQNSIETEGDPLIQLSSIKSMALGDIKKDIIEILIKII